MSGERDLDAIRTWQIIVRDTISVLVGAFMLVFDTAFSADPNPYVIGGGLTAIGLPLAARLDLRKRDAFEE